MYYKISFNIFNICLIKKLSSYKISNELGISIWSSPIKSTDIMNFLICSSPDILKYFEFRGVYDYSENSSLCFYWIKEVASRTIEILKVNLMNLDTYEFCSLIKAAKHCKIINLDDWILQTDHEWYFGEMNTCWITELSLLNVGKKSNWMYLSQRWTNIMLGIKNCPNFSSQLIKIVMSGTELINFILQK